MKKTKSTKRKIIEWTVQGILMIALFFGLTAWQSRKLVATDTVAPDFSLTTIAGQQVQLSNSKGKKVVLYFFAPWCSVCKYSSHNIVDLRNARSSDDMDIYAVGLGWETPDEVATFAKKHELNVPVLIGDNSLAQDYRVDTFPTVYIIDENGMVSSRMVGYTTELGLRLRSL